MVDESWSSQLDERKRRPREEEEDEEAERQRAIARVVPRETGG